MIDRCLQPVRGLVVLLLLTHTECSVKSAGHALVLFQSILFFFFFFLTTVSSGAGSERFLG